jgi:hypothetical protein
MADRERPVVERSGPNAGADGSIGERAIIHDEPHTTWHDERATMPLAPPGSVGLRRTQYVVYSARSGGVVGFPVGWRSVAGANRETHPDEHLMPCYSPPSLLESGLTVPQPRDHCAVRLRPRWPHAPYRPAASIGHVHDRDTSYGFERTSLESNRLFSIAVSRIWSSRQPGCHHDFLRWWLEILAPGHSPYYVTPAQPLATAPSGRVRDSTLSPQKTQSASSLRSILRAMQWAHVTSIG